VRLYHNPRCSKSRAALDLLQARGVDVDVIEYLQHPPSPAELRELLACLRMSPRELLRTGETEYTALGLDATDVDDDRILEAMAAHPRLIERPVFVCAERAVVGRPPERVLELLDATDR
jgi:arsenate reductase